MPQIRYDKQRKMVTPPHVSLEALRNALGLRQTDVLARMEEVLGRKVTAGALSAVERGHRGASPDFLSALEMALGLRDGDLKTDFEPSHSRLPKPVEDIPA